MSAVRGELPLLLDPTVLEMLGTQVFTAASTLADAANQANDQWKRLPEVFVVEDAGIAETMLDGPAGTAADFVEAMKSARRVLDEFTVTTIPALQKRRDELEARILTVNQEHETAQSGLESADAAYWRSYETDPASDSTRRAGEAQTDATDAWRDAQDAVIALEADIRVFRIDVEAAEDFLASDLKGISGGDDPRGAWGVPVTSTQSSWGDTAAPYPGGPVSDETLADRLRGDMSDAVAARITALGNGDPDGAKEWLGAHPDFAGTVGFVDVDRARALWDQLGRASTRGDDGAWAMGPLAVLLGGAPTVIGNLNGIPAAAKDEFNRAELERLLDGELTDDQRRKLESVQDLLADSDAETAPVISLLSLFFETDDGSPRVSLGFGEVDNAGQVTTLTHGISTDVTQIGEWSDSAIALQKATMTELSEIGSSATTAVVLFMEWDSGGPSNVWELERPHAGAERLAQLLRGFDRSNPNVQLDLGLHSLGTTMGAEMVANNPGLVQNAWLYGSAGIAEETAADLENLIRRNELNLFATHAEDDFIAPMGRFDVSTHTVDPRTIAGAETFGSDGGWVLGYGDGDRDWGERVEGHNSQASTEWFYLLDGFKTQQTGGMSPSFIPQWDDEAVGYLDPRSQSFKQTVVDLVDSIVLSEGARS
ncbi:alpha/beta hydrolase [Microbacterium galbinum]|uniref:Alpha/beta hydrolase family protein n=1 Tax=Microbacterium galbinum TaxID=2851646 RepID=A0ABY4IRH3_9MICO|nr:alpha/beta hydrolase [Microbacterium galbinum]UPL14511.1 alpha/beta hydrolase family protein [Microbacterium galbinum]